MHLESERHYYMQVKRTNTSDTEIKLTIVASPEELQSMKQHVLGHFRNKVKIAGFREGKAPLELVEKNIEASVFQSEYLEEIINTMYGQAIRDEKLRPVSTPEVNVKKFVTYTTLEFDATLSIIGDVVLPDYKKFRLAKKAVKITAADVTDVIKNLQNRAADKKDVTRAAKLTDQVTIDFLGKNEKGEAIAGADGKDYPLTLGSNTFIPGFEPEVVGMKAGEEKTFDVTFPADYHAKDLASKKVSFTVNVTKVQELVEPKADDVFAATVGPFTTIEELKTDIKKQLEVERQAEADKAYENELVGALAEQTSVALPPAIVEEQIDKIEDQERQNLVYRGQTWEEHLK